ncbi:MAG: helix-turn-helix domain-containing protein [Bacilli bacterium]|nr:helix-turn-helix domain-containing protein [Bacilli bacterium]
MNQEKTGKFIATLRKEKKLTQEQLAEKLGVSSKSLSRWENGRCMPDFSLLDAICKELEISVSELLNGRRMNKEDMKGLKETIRNLTEYYAKKKKTSRKQVFGYIKLGIVGIDMLTSIICLICNYVIDKQFDWSLIVIASLLFSWVLLIPILNQKEQPVKKCLAVLSIAIVPYLFVLSKIIGEELIFKMGAIISIVSLLAIWGSYSAFVRFKNRKLFATGITFLIVIPLTFAINSIGVYFMQTPIRDWISDLVNILFSLGLAILFFYIDRIKNRYKENEID